MQIVTEAPLWWIVFCAIGGLAYASVLYYRERQFEELARWKVWTMATLRFLSVFIIIFLLLTPLLKTMVTHLEKPVFIVALDESESMVETSDTNFIQQKLKPELNQLIDKLGEEYEVRTYSFGEAVKEELDYNFNQKETNISSLIDELNIRYLNRNVGGAIIVTDGLYNRGMNPAYDADELGFSVYPVAVGDTTIHRDLVLKKVAHNDIAYLGNEFPLEIVYGGKRLTNEKFTLTVSHNGKVLHKKDITLGKTQYGTEKVLLEAQETGIQHYVVKLSPVENEITLANNTAHVYIDILDGRQKILILAHSPHPDIAAMRYAIQKKEEYEVEVVLADEFNGKVEKYNLIILHQLPSRTFRADAIINNAREKNVSVLYVLGAQSDVSAFNRINKDVTIQGGVNRTNESMGLLQDDFPLFQLDEDLKLRFDRFPPLIAPFGKYNVSKDAYVLFKQKIGLVKTETPLVCFLQRNQQKTGYILGEGMWHWRLSDFERNGDHQAFDQLMTKMVQYLSVRVDKSTFRVHTDHTYYENEDVTFEAQLYDDSYELINEPDVKLKVKDKEGKEYDYTLGKTNKSYFLNLGRLPVGEYTYKAMVSFGGKDYLERGSFMVNQLNVEQMETSANHRILYQMAEATGGEVLYAGGLMQWADQLAESGDVVTVQHSNEELYELINWKWIFFLILGLLTAEWFMRKRNGAY